MFESIEGSVALPPAIPPQVNSITPTTGPNVGYLPLSLLGVGPVPGVGDDTITNFTVPTFFYGAETYTSIGVVSNGYLVVGGGTGSDVAFPTQSFPNTARPNNTLALLWTDLNPAGGGGAGNIRVAVLSDGPPGPTTTSWLVVDWGGVKNFSNATTHSFEIWLR